jgi:hypothetical protein
MGKTRDTGFLTNGLWQDASNNIGIGGSPSGSFKFDVTGTGRFTGATYLATGGGSVGIGTTSPAQILHTETATGTNNIHLFSLSGATRGFMGVAGISNSILNEAAVGDVVIRSQLGKILLGTFQSGGSDAFAALTIANNRNVGIGTSSPWGKFNVYAGSNLSFVVQDSGAADTIELTNYSSGGGLRGIQLNGSPITFGTGTAGGGSSPERMRIQADGSILAGTTNDGFFNGSVQGLGLFGTNGFIAASRNGGSTAFFNRYTSTGDVVNFRYAGSNVGSISTNGSTVTFSGNAVSDERFKENIKPIENALDSINKIEFKTFVYKNNQQFSAGVTAQQLQTIEELSKYVIDGIDEESYKAVDYNAIIGYLGKAIQEQNQLIEELSVKVSALENKS